MPPNRSCELPRIELRPAGQVGVEPLEAPVVERQHVVLPGLDQEQALELARASRAARPRGRAPASSRRGRRAPRRRRRRRHLGRHPRDAVAGDRGPALVVDAAVAEHLEVLRLAALGRRRRRRTSSAIETPSIGICWTPLTNAARAGRPPRGPSARRRSRGGTACGPRPSPRSRRPVDDRAVAGAAPVRGDLLGPLVRRVHRVRPADRVVVVGLGRAEHVDPRGHELGRLEPGGAVEDDQLVEAAVAACPRPRRRCRR